MVRNKAVSIHSRHCHVRTSRWKQQASLLHESEHMHERLGEMKAEKGRSTRINFSHTLEVSLNALMHQLCTNPPVSATLEYGVLYLPYQ